MIRRVEAAHCSRKNAGNRRQCDRVGWATVALRVSAKP
jgi:hypothetical protein